MFKSLVLSFFLFTSLSVLAFTPDECLYAAKNVAMGQVLLNDSPDTFKELTTALATTPASEFDISESLKAYVLANAKKLKPGGDPTTVGVALLNSCLKQKTI